MREWRFINPPSIRFSTDGGDSSDAPEGLSTILELFRPISSMKGWFAAGVGLSGLILGWFLVSMDSCGHTYEIDAQGRLLEGLASAMKPEEASRRPALRWNEKLPQFIPVAAYVRPGDQLEETTTTGGYPVLSVSMSSLKVTRNGQVVLTARDGALKFWAVIVGLCAWPLFLWGVVAFWIAVARSRPRSPPPG
jgi:hypothetical protein